MFMKLESLGISQKALRIIKCIYNDFKIDINSNTVRIKRGVLQGSLISPFLFNFYLNDLIQQLGRVVPIDNVFGYADDLLIVTLG
jgi:hypothetical protein